MLIHEINALEAIKNKVRETNRKANEIDELFEKILKFLLEQNSNLISRWKSLKNEWKELIRSSRQDAKSLSDFILYFKNELLPQLNSAYSHEQKQEYITEVLIHRISREREESKQHLEKFNKLREDIIAFSIRFKRIQDIEKLTSDLATLNAECSSINITIGCLVAAFVIGGLVIFGGPWAKSILNYKYAKLAALISSFIGSSFVIYKFVQKGGKKKEIEEINKVLNAESNINKITEDMKSLGGLWEYFEMLFTNYAKSLGQTTIDLSNAGNNGFSLDRINSNINHSTMELVKLASYLDLYAANITF
ncbi:1420_t:CDS:2 [Ambispora leptoticha]|uniref:1420_t:CDS:1 n=1 Tax=Ambispora leptoticha TaxID=144679 RepID=A0A9N9G2I5_9GLOM|nr:1420_t:CDS:2 [Ambispora leptoticha]